MLCTRPTNLVLDFYSASLLKQQSSDRHIAPLGLFNAACLAEWLTVVC